MDTILFRIAGWGTVTALAMGAVVFIAQTPQGSERLQVAFAGTVLPQEAVAAVKTSDPAVAVLQAKLERLSAERERLEARLASLEHGLEDVTGSIRKVGERDASVSAGRTATTLASPPIIEPPAIPAMETLTLTPKPASPEAEAPPVASAPQTATAVPEPKAAPAEPAAQKQAEPASPPVRVAALPAHAHRPAEYGIELGSAPDHANLQSRWTAIKANFGPLLVGLSPVAIKDKRPGNSTLKLLAGPVKSMAAARELCAKFAAQNGYCFPRQVDAADVVQH